MAKSAGRPRRPRDLEWVGMALEPHFQVDGMWVLSTPLHYLTFSFRTISLLSNFFARYGEMMCDAFSDSKRFHAYMLKHRNGEVGAILSFRPSPVHNINQRWNLHKARTSAGTGLLMGYAWSSLKATPTCSMTGQRAAIFILIGQFWPVQVWVYSAHDTLGISRCLEIRWLSPESKKHTHTSIHYMHPSIPPSLPTYVQYVRTHVCTHLHCYTTLHYITLHYIILCSPVQYSTVQYITLHTVYASHILC